MILAHQNKITSTRHKTVKLSNRILVCQSFVNIYQSLPTICKMLVTTNFIMLDKTNFSLIIFEIR